MIDPIQSQTGAATPPSGGDPSRLVSEPSASTAVGGEKTPSPSSGKAAAQGAQTSGSSGASDAQSSSDAAQPLRLLIEHDKATNHYVYKLYDSSGRIVREIPQESLADAQKQAAGAAGAVVDTKV